MLILEREIEMIAVTEKNANYYRNKGYNVQLRIPFNVKPIDLPPGSNKKVWVKCDYCGKEYQMVFQKYIKRVLEATVHKCACRECEHLKIAESNMINYGMSTNALPEVKARKLQSNRDNYGVDNPMQLKKFQDKQKQTMVDRYGVEYSAQSSTLRAKTINTWMTNYGVNHPSKSNEILEKRNKNNLEKYGVEHTLQLDSVREQIAQTSYKNSTCKVSAEQLHLKELFSADLNYPIGKYNADLLLADDVILELDGSGHELNILYGNVSQEEFQRKEERRTRYILSQGYKIIRFSHKRHTRIRDWKYIDALEKCLDKLDAYNCVCYDFDTDELIV